ncbi:cobamide remodeling phosphodiesterase CbiR [Fundidesulfovibrio butyratiphilus]
MQFYLGPWPLAATSWLWPLPLAENLARLAELELSLHQAALLFYRYRACLDYTPEDIGPSTSLASHVHLPVDLPWERGGEAVYDILARLMDMAAPHKPWGGVLHPPDSPDDMAGLARVWRERAPGWRLLLENVPGQDLMDHWPVILDLDLPVCLDVGHLLAFEQHRLLAARGLAGRVELVHCYAPGLAVGTHEHLSLARLAPSQAWALRACLDFLPAGAPVLFEVFSEADLRESLETFYAFTMRWGLTI